MALTPEVVDDLHENSKKMLELWMKIKLVLIKAFGEGEIAREHETAFLQLKSDVSRIYRLISDKLPPGLKFDGDKAMEMLKNAMTMEHLHQLPAGERQNIYKVWHAVYIRLTRTLGALETMKLGYYPHLHRARLQSRHAATAKK
jgi:hypothetical protein